MLSIYRLQTQSQKQPLRHISLHGAKKCEKIAVTLSGVERRRVPRVHTETASSSLLPGRKQGFLRLVQQQSVQVLLLQALYRGRETVASTIYITHEITPQVRCYLARTPGSP